MLLYFSKVEEFDETKNQRCSPVQFSVQVVQLARFLVVMIDNFELYPIAYVGLQHPTHSNLRYSGPDCLGGIFLNQ